MHVLAALCSTVDDEGAPARPLDGEMVVLPATGTGEDDVGLHRREPRGFVGLDSHGDVRSAEVVEIDVTPHVVMAHVRESLARDRTWDEDALVDAAAQLTAEMLSVAQQFPIGTVLDRDGRLLRAHIPLTGRDGRRPVCDPADGWGGPR